MQISKLKEIGEVVSIIAIIVTLVFLILEVRENTAALRTESYGESIDRLNTWRLELASNNELISMFDDFIEGLEMDLSPADDQKLQFVIGSLWSIYESAFFARNYGTMGESEWIRFERMMCQQYISVLDQNYWPRLDLILSLDFREYVEQQCN